MTVDLLHGASDALFELLARRLPLRYALRLFDAALVVQASAFALMLLSGLVMVLFGSSFFGRVEYVLFCSVGVGVMLVGLAGVHWFWIARCRILEARRLWPQTIRLLRKIDKRS